MVNVSSRVGLKRRYLSDYIILFTLKAFVLRSMCTESKIVPIDSPHFRRVMAVCVDAMMVGSIEVMVEEGEYVQRGQEFECFAFGVLFRFFPCRTTRSSPISAVVVGGRHLASCSRRARWKC